MPWKQERSVRIEQMGTRPGFCLVNTRIAANPDIPAKYSTAKLAADKALLHQGAAPSGVWTPIYFDFWATYDGKYANWGHIGWQAPDGSFYSDGKKYANVGEYDRTHAPNVIGWGELINDVRVVRWEADPVRPPKSGRSHLHLNKGSITTTYNKNGSIYARDNTYDYTILEDRGHMVRINSKSVGGNCWVYLIYQTGAKKGQTIEGRWAK